MPILTTKPTPYTDADGHQYPFYAVHSLHARVSFEPKKLACPAVLNLQPYRVEADGTIIPATLPDGAPVVVTTLVRDAYDQSKHDPALAQLFGGTLQLIAGYVTAKGL